MPHWPKPWGLAADAELQLIIDQEMKRAGVHVPRNPVAINNCAQSLLTHGTEEHRQRYLLPALAGEEIWCMLFSEPSGGSDLGALRTVARRDGDHYVVKGHKIWTSLAHKAKVGILVARTNSDVPKHQGLSQFLLDMDTPGITVRPIIDMSAHENEYNEVFLDEVRIPADRLLGKEGDGWALSMTQLQTERVALSRPGAIWGHGPSARELVEGLAEIGALDDGAMREEAAQVYVEGEILRLLAYRALSDRMNARPPGPEGAIHKMLAAPHGQKVVELAKRAQGPRGMIAGEIAISFAAWRQRRSLRRLGSRLLVQPGGHARRRHAGDPEERRRRTHARPAARTRSDRAGAVLGDAGEEGLEKIIMYLALSVISTKARRARGEIFSTIGHRSWKQGLLRSALRAPVETTEETIGATP